MRKSLKPAVAVLYRIPVVGYLLRILAGIFGLPRLRAKSRGFNKQIAALDQGVRVNAWEVTALKQHLPAFLNAVGSVGALGYQVAELKRALEREADKIARLCDAVSALKTQVESGASQIAALGGQVTNLTARPSVTALSASADSLNSLEQQVDSLAAAQKQIWARLEFVRNEVLYEFRHARTPSTEIASPVTTIRSPEKLATTVLRLNLGCGHVPREGYVNVDMRDLPGVDVVAPVDKLPVAAESVAEIYSSHLLEHFESEHLVKTLLPYWRKLLAAGGRFTAVVPDAHAMSIAYTSGQYPFEDFRAVLFGGQDYDGDYHFNMFTPDSLMGILKAAGFSDLKVTEAGRRNGRCFEFEITGIRT